MAFGEGRGNGGGSARGEVEEEAGLCACLDNRGLRSERAIEENQKGRGNGNRRDVAKKMKRRINNNKRHGSYTQIYYIYIEHFPIPPSFSI